MAASKHTAPKVETKRCRTVVQFANLPKRDERYVVRDAEAPGLCLRVNKDGSKTWFTKSLRRPGEPANAITIGPFSPTPLPGALTLDEAREKYRAMRASPETHRPETLRLHGRSVHGVGGARWCACSPSSWPRS